MASPKVSLYMCPGTSSIFPQVLLHYAGISYTPIPVPIKNVSLEFTKTNPKGQIPVLMLDGELITENPAIAQAINHLAPSANIMGSKPMEFIRICEWMNFLSASIHAQVWGAWMRPYRFTDEPEARAGVKRQALTRLRDRFAHLESKLPAKGWAVGDGFTAVDAYLIHASQWAERAGISIEADYPKWAALMKRIRAEDLVQQALAEEEQISRDMAAS